MITCRLAILLAERKLRMSDLVEKADVAFHTVSRYYHDEHIKQVDLDIVEKFCSALDCSLEDLFVIKKEERKQA